MSTDASSDLADDATRQALADHARGKRIDHDANLRQARTSMNAWRDRSPWGTKVRRFIADQFYEETASPDDGVDEQLLDMRRLERDRIEALALLTHRTYRSLLRRRQKLHGWRRRWEQLNTNENATCPRMPDGW